MTQWTGLDLAEPFKPFTVEKKASLFTKTIPATRRSKDRIIMRVLGKKGNGVDETGHFGVHGKQIYSIL
ncbi:MAG: hypothetical protein SWE60_14935 [Thermodesulfobacteriota bacterium]|nr:hypothetical protein [Thermodesulfobacteriota bacterium]